MAMKWIKSASVTVPDAAEVVTEIITGTEDFPKRVVRVNCDSQEGVRLVGYLDDTQIIDAPADIVAAQQGIEDINIDVELGRRLKLGFQNNSGSQQTLWLMIEYVNAKG